MKIDAIKKVFKKIIIILCCLMLFLFPPKMNDDFVFQDNSNVMEVEAGAITGSLTWAALKAAAAAAGSALAPVAVGAVGAAAIGWVVDETIGWDVIADFGQGVIDTVLGNGGTVDEIYDAETETVRLTQEFVGATATAVDTLPSSIIVDYGVWTALPNITLDSNSTTHSGFDVNIPLDYNQKLIIRGNYDMRSSAAYAISSYFAVRYKGSINYSSDSLDHISVPKSTSLSGEFESIFSAPSERLIEEIKVFGSGSRGSYISYSNLRMTLVVDDVIPKDVTVEDLTGVKEAVGATIEERNTYITNIIGGVDAIPLDDKQAVTGVNFAELAAATQPDDIEEGTENDLGILGILGMIYNYIKTLPVRIVGAFTSLFNMIINAIKAIPDVITSGIDNLLININAVASNIRAGIDDLLIDINALGANIRAGIDNLLINVSAIPDAIASGIDNLLINMGDWTDSLINTWVSGLGVIIGGINDIWSWLTGFGEWLINLVVPTSLDALQPSIAQLTGTFNDRFSFIITPIKSFGNAYSQSKSLYDVTFRIKYRDVAEDVHVLPIAYKPAVDVFRLVANGVVVVLTYISMYNRFRKEVLTG